MIQKTTPDGLNTLDNSLVDRAKVSLSGRCLSRISNQLMGKKEKNRTVFLARRLESYLHISSETPVAKTTSAIAKKLDTGCLCDKIAYHNIQHTYEVMLSMASLIRLNEGNPEFELDDHDKSLLLLGAEIHDLKHDGLGNQGQPFKLEEQAFEAALPFLEKNKISKQDRDMLHGMVLATDISVQPKAMDGIRKILADPEKQAFDPEDIHPQWPKELHYLLQAPHARNFSKFAGMLSDADLLPSAGWSPEHHRMQTMKLSEETHGKIPEQIGQCTIDFLDKIVGGRFSTKAGQYFQPNLENIKVLAETIIDVSCRFKNGVPDILVDALCYQMRKPSAHIKPS